MDFKDKYTADKVKEPNKVEISTEAFALSEVIQDLTEQLRILNNRKW